MWDLDTRTHHVLDVFLLPAHRVGDLRPARCLLSVLYQRGVRALGVVVCMVVVMAVVVALAVAGVVWVRVASGRLGARKKRQRRVIAVPQYAKHDHAEDEGNKDSGGMGTPR